MTESNRLVYLAGILVFVSAAIHLSLGVAGLGEAFAGGGSALLPSLYLLGGVAALALLGVIALAPTATTTYVAGAGLMGLLLLAYADVHAFGVAESTLGVDAHDHGHGDGHDHASEGHGHDHSDGGHDHDGEGHSHDHDEHDHDGEGHSHDHDDHGGGTLSVLADHLRDDTYALVSKTAEASAAVVLIVLALRER